MLCQATLCELKLPFSMLVWQGLAISIVVHLHGHVNDSESNTGKNDRHDQATAIQNLLICVEMLFFSVAHWCVFPAEEWEPNYRPKEYARPGLGIKDFAKDVRVIMRRGQHHGAVPIPQNPRSMDIEPDDGSGSNDLVEDDNII